MRDGNAILGRMAGAEGRMTRENVGEGDLFGRLTATKTAGRRQNWLTRLHHRWNA